MKNELVIAEYTSSLQDLRFNSKPLITFLTGMAGKKIYHAPSVVEAIEKHLYKVEPAVKLPILYLIDSIVKNVGQTYPTLFSRNIVKTFCNVFRVVDPQTRMAMFKLRQTWMNIFPQKLHDLDVQVNMLDKAWPVTPKLNHFNGSLDIQEMLIQKQKDLIEVKQKKLQLEMLKLQNELKSNLRSKLGDPRLLRRHNEQNTNGVSKKRSSIESLEAAGSKKPKVEVDALFGNEDTDLRLMVQPECFPKPPLPLITNKPLVHHQNTELTESINCVPTLPDCVNIDELFKKLVAAGIIVNSEEPSNITTQVEDKEKRENFFDQHREAESVSKEIEVATVSAIGDSQGELCLDKFAQFFHEHKDNSIRYEDYQTSLEENKIPGLDISHVNNDVEVHKFEQFFHEHKDNPICNEDYQRSLEENKTPGLDISHNTSLEVDSKKDKVMKEDERQDGDDDDVMIVEMVPEVIVVDDDKEYVDLPVKVRTIEEQQLNKIDIKTEPLDEDELAVDHIALEPVERVEPVPFIDGNTEHISALPSFRKKIKINISRQLPVVAPKRTMDIRSVNESSLPVVDPPLMSPSRVKPALKNIELKTLPIVKKGTEMTGMCSIM